MTQSHTYWNQCQVRRFPLWQLSPACGSPKRVWQTKSTVTYYGGSTLRLQTWLPMKEILWSQWHAITFTCLVTLLQHSIRNNIDITLCILSQCTIVNLSINVTSQRKQVSCTQWHLWQIWQTNWGTSVDTTAFELEKVLLDPIFILKWMNFYSLWIMFLKHHVTNTSSWEAETLWIVSKTRSKVSKN